jgi:hypothetical protein
MCPVLGLGFQNSHHLENNPRAAALILQAIGSMRTSIGAIRRRPAEKKGIEAVQMIALGMHSDTPLGDRETAILALSLGMSVDPRCHPDSAMQDLALAVLDLACEDF